MRFLVQNFYDRVQSLRYKLQMLRWKERQSTNPSCNQLWKISMPCQSLVKENDSQKQQNESREILLAGDTPSDFLKESRA